MKGISTLIIMATCIVSMSAQLLVNSQDANLPLYTELSDDILRPYNKLFSKADFSLEGMMAFREFLKPYAKKGDPIGMFMYAKAHDLYPFKKGSKKDGLVALEYFEKASNLGLADASYVLYGHYRNGHMNMPKDSFKSLEYLHKAIEQGTNTSKAALLNGLAKLYHSETGEQGVNKSFPAVNYNIESTKHYLQEAIKYNPNNSFAKGYLAELNLPTVTK